MGEMGLADSDAIAELVRRTRVAVDGETLEYAIA
jgi:hypothetical protein